MRLEDVRKLPVVERWLYFVNERESCRYGKDVLHTPKPWTDDEILTSYRFCNMRRMDDKVSQWLLKNWYEPYKDHPSMLQACTLARFVNLPASLELLTEEVFHPVYRVQPGLRYGMLKELLYRRKAAGETIFNGAYVVRGNEGDDKIDCVVTYYVKPLEKVKIDPSSMEKTWEILYGQFGFGSFMAGQVTADLRHAVTGRWGDRNIWAPIGPGSKRGMNRILGRHLTDPLRQAEFLAELTKLRELAAKLPLASRMECIDWQNTLCEFDKYERALHGEGKPKQKYPGK